MKSLTPIVLWCLLIYPIADCRATANKTVDEPEEYQRYDGWYNNRAHPHWGAKGSLLLRKVPAAYSDGAYRESGKDRPNPRYISEKALKGPSGLASYKNRTVALGLFGQFVSLELLKASSGGCPRESTPIPVPKCDPHYDPNCTGTKVLSFVRAKHDTKTGRSPGRPREQSNGVTSWIDGSAIYSVKLPWSNALRSHKNGTLKSRDGDGLWPAFNVDAFPVGNPPPAREHVLMAPERQWLLGDPRLFQHHVMLTFGVLFMRYHNTIAQRLAAENPDWSDERLYQTARRWVIATEQKIIAYDFYEAFTNEKLPPYAGYRDYIDPSISHIFQSAAFRFGHSFVPPGFYRRDAQCNFFNTTQKTAFPGYTAVRLCNAWWHGDEAFEFGIEPLIMGMSSQITEREDHILVDDVRGSLFGPLQNSGRDLATLNIQRGRDNGLPDYNTARQAMGLEPVNNWTQINPGLAQREPDAIKRLEETYSDRLDLLDIFVGGLFEATENGPGPLFMKALEDQFTRVRDGDRFWFENRINGLFTESEIQQILNTTLYDIILMTTDVQPNSIQKNIFFWHDGDPCPQPKQLEISDMAECNKNFGYDYFTGSGNSFLIILGTVLLFPILCIGLVKILHIIKQRKDWRHVLATKNKVGDISDQYIESGGGILAEEWLGKHESRSVLIALENGTLHVNDVNGTCVRSVNLKAMGKITIKMSDDHHGNILCFIFPRGHDLVLKFSDTTKSHQLNKAVSQLAEASGINVELVNMSGKQITEKADTRERRKEKAEKVLHHVFHQTLGGTDYIKHKKMKPAELQKILELEMARDEFAESIGLKPDSAFVENLFAVVDKDGDGFISFQEFMDVLILLSSGSEDDKMRLLFDMYDVDSSGIISIANFIHLLRCVLEISDKPVTEERVIAIMKAMLSEAGMANKESITFEEFRIILSKEKSVVNFSGARFKADLSKRQVKSSSSLPSVKNISGMTNKPLHIQQSNPGFEDTSSQNMFCRFLKFTTLNRLNIIYLLFFFLITVAVFIERSVYYATLNESQGLRRITGHGVSISRGTASAMSFTFGVVMLTMCKNTISMLQGTWVAGYVPLESSLAMHKVSAWTSAVLALAHTIGHLFNFYHVSTQPTDYVGCIFMNTIWFRTDYLPSFVFWLFETVTGFTGVALVFVLTLMVVFSTEWARSKVYGAFWFTHSLHVIVYALLILHGSAVLVQDPWFYFFWLGPGLLFVLDKLYTVNRISVPFTCIEAEHMPSDVTYIKLKKPASFNNRSGQWARIAVEGHHGNEYHPLTITSAEHENFLTFHVRAKGPWTAMFRQWFDSSNYPAQPYPKVYVDGPFGGISESWHKYEVTVMIGAGIGITPYASILKQVSYLNSIRAEFPCKKIYFFWVTKDQRQFEWMIDILREVEEADVNDMVTVNLFVTQLLGKFDLRTAIMYLCEKHFVNMSNGSLFTGLKAPTNFGRPNFLELLADIANQWSKVKTFGVFSTGSVSLTTAVAKACSEANKATTAAFHHYEENF